MVAEVVRHRNLLRKIDRNIEAVEEILNGDHCAPHSNRDPLTEAPQFMLRTLKSCRTAITEIET